MSGSKVRLLEEGVAWAQRLTEQSSFNMAEGEVDWEELKEESEKGQVLIVVWGLNFQALR